MSQGSSSPLQPLFHRPVSAGGMGLATRIILINAVAMMMMVAGLLYFGRYFDRLIGNEVNLLFRQAQLIAGKIESEAIGQVRQEPLDPAPIREIVARLTLGTNVRTQVFNNTGLLITDSHPHAPSPETTRQTPTARPGDGNDTTSGRALRIFDWLAMLIPYGNDLPVYNHTPAPQVGEMEDVTSALTGQPHWMLWTDRNKNLLITFAVPVRISGTVAGAVRLTRDDADIAATLRDLRVELLQISGLMLGISMVLSLYMAQTIARPLRRLARAARRAQAIAGGPPSIPDYRERGDEIGELSVALQAMTRALWDRLDAIEAFAADVSHEIKNPLTSMKSALETLSRVRGDEQRSKLIAILHEDVIRMQRLITDIAAASRLEAELSRTTPELFDLSAVITNLVTSRTGAGALIDYHVSATGLMVRGIPGRLIQVAENLIANAISFSPPGQPVLLRLTTRNRQVVLSVEDSGSGIAPGKEEKIFERFYSERPSGEEFGTHSGLGLSICRQIVEGHGGHIRAENRRDETGRILGARFTVELPLQLT